MNSITREESAATVLGVQGRMFGVVSASDGRILNQTFKAARTYQERGNDYMITVEMRFDDECNNGHESFAITADIRENRREYMGGCCHDEIVKLFPEFAPLIKWHLTSTDGPMHYEANTLYWLGLSGYCDGKAGSPPNMNHARSCAVWPDMPEGMDKAQALTKLKQRLPGLLAEFHGAMVGAGFVYPEPRK